MPVALLMLLGFLWSARLAAIKTAGIAGVSAQVAVPVALLMAALVFNATAWIRGSWAPLTKQTIPFFLFSGLCGMVLPFALEVVIAPHLAVFVFFMIIATNPVMTLGLAAILGLEQTSRRQVVAIALGFCVALMIAAESALGASVSAMSWWWVLAAFVVPLLYSINALFVASRWPRGMDALQAAQGQSLFMASALILGSLVVGMNEDWHLSADQIPPVLAIGTFEVLAIFVYLEVIRRAGASFVSLANYIAIVLVAWLGFTLFGEALSWWSIGAAIVLVISVSFAKPQERSAS